MEFKTIATMISAVSAIAVTSGCAGSAGAAATGGGAPLSHAGTAAPTATAGNANPAAHNTNTATTVGPNCKSGDSNHICLGVKYVVYEDAKNQPVVSQADVVNNITGINKVWNQCNIGFQVEQLVNTQPTQNKLSFTPANTGDLDDIRKVYNDSNTLLVATTGTWDRSGSLGSSGANAWTSMPGELLYGAVLESPVGKFANIIAHELGHYLNLDHVSDDTDLMNPIIGDNSQTLTADQCSTARASVPSYWQQMVRSG